MGVFERLGFDFTDANNIIDLSDPVIEYLNTVPRLLDTWQEQDISANNVGGYFRNPMSNVISDIIDVSDALMIATDNVQGSMYLPMIYEAANTIQKSNGTAQFFQEHTDRISGVTDLKTDEVDEIFPYYTTAISVGQSVMYLTNQVDGIQNNAPIMGSFTSLLVEDELNVTLTIVQTYPQIIIDSIVETTEGMPPNTYIVKTSTLTDSELLPMYNNVALLNNTMLDRMNHDITFYRNSIQVMDDFDQLRAFNNTGETQELLINNFVGTDKLKSRINT